MPVGPGETQARNIIGASVTKASDHCFAIAPAIVQIRACPVAQENAAGTVMFEFRFVLFHCFLVYLLVYVKTFFTLGGSYAGFKVRRLAQCGRLWLVQVLGYHPEAAENRGQKSYEPEPNPYWFVQVRNFDRGKDLSLVPEMGVLPHDNCTFRFTDLEKAKAKYDRLAEHPRVMLEEKKREKLRQQSAERLKAYRIPFQKKG